MPLNLGPWRVCKSEGLLINLIVQNSTSVPVWMLYKATQKVLYKLSFHNS